MTDEGPIACSLEATDLHRRLLEIAALGAESLLEHSVDGERQLLRFRADPTTRRRLQAIVAAEAACCPFLDLSLEDEPGQLLLSIGSSEEEGRPIAQELAAKFTEPSRRRGPTSHHPPRGGRP